MIDSGRVTLGDSVMIVLFETVARASELGLIDNPSDEFFAGARDLAVQARGVIDSAYLPDEKNPF
jgi:hypothetical protein